MINKLGFQLYTIRDYYRDNENANEKTLYDALTQLKAGGYDEVQLAGLGDIISEERFAEILKETGFVVQGTHWDTDEILNNPEEAMRKHIEYFDTKIMGFGSVPAFARQDMESLNKFINDINCVAQKVKDYGFKITLHNHHWEFVRLEPDKTILEYVVEKTDPDVISVCLDTHWVQRGGGNPTTWIEKLKDRIDILHLKDMGTERKDSQYLPYFAEIGYGNMDFDGIMAAAERSNVKYYCVEQDICPVDPIKSLKMSADYIKAHYMK